MNPSSREFVPSFLLKRPDSNQGENAPQEYLPLNFQSQNFQNFQPQSQQQNFQPFQSQPQQQQQNFQPFQQQSQQNFQPFQQQQNFQPQQNFYPGQQQNFQPQQNFQQQQQQPVVKETPKAKPKGESKPKGEPKQKAESKPKGKNEPKPKGEPKQKSKAEPKQKATESKPKPKAEPKQKAKSEPKTESKTEHKEDSTPKDETDEKPDNYEPSEEEIAKELERLNIEEKNNPQPVMETKEEESKEHVNVVFIGHVDAGKSTLSGQILMLSGQVDQRTLEKYEKEAKDNNRESWWLAYVMDTNEEERAKGKTVEVGRANFETPNKRFTLLDAPGHKNYVPNMIGGASQADVAILVISARKGEFESGFEKGGQTKEHTVIAKTLGVKYLIIVINKMDDYNWEKSRYDEITDKLTPFLKQTGYNMKDVIYVPISALKGQNVNIPLDKKVCTWYEGPTLLGALDALKPMERLMDYPFRAPVIDKFRDGGKLWVSGKVETGIVSVGSQVVFMPSNLKGEITEISTDVSFLKIAKPGENVRFALKGIDEENVHSGYVICSVKQPIPCQTTFVCQLSILELLPHKSVFSAGYNAVIHIHTAVEECTLKVLLELYDKKTGKIEKKRPDFVKSGALVRGIIECSQPIALELFSDVPQLGRFTLRDEGKTIAIGKVTGLGPKKEEK